MNIQGFNLMVRSVTSGNRNDHLKSNNVTPPKPANRLRNRNSGQDFRPSDTSTSDPTTANARIYVGNIQGDSITRDDLKKYFSNFGIVTSASLHKNKGGKKSFAFIQFSDEEGAQNCLLIGKNVFINGQQLDVGPVKSDQASTDISPWDMMRPTNRPYDGPSTQFSSRNFSSPVNSPPFSSAGLGMGMGMGMGMGLNQMPSMPVSQCASLAKDLDPDRPNDAEIVVASVDLRSYAEYIESHLLSLNMKVDLIFPPPGLSTSKIISDLIKRKCLFAIMITLENEVHRSLSLHILYGQQLQAHCNIPVANAFKLVEENFTEYIQMSRQQMVPQTMTPGIYGGNAFGQSSLGVGGSRNTGLFGSSSSSTLLGGQLAAGNSNDGLLGPVPSDSSSLLGAVPAMSSGGGGQGGRGDMSNMYSLVLDSVQMAKDLKNVKGEIDVKQLMARREFQERVAALRAKAVAVKQNLMQPPQNFY